MRKLKIGDHIQYNDHHDLVNWIKNTKWEVIDIRSNKWWDGKSIIDSNAFAIKGKVVNGFSLNDLEKYVTIINKKSKLPGWF